MAGTALRAPCPAAAASRKSSVRLLNSTFLLLAVFALLAGLLDCGSRGLAWQASQAAAEVESYVSRGALGSGQMREAAFIINTDAPHAAMARVRPTVVAAAVPRSLCWLQAWHDLNVFVGRSTNAVFEGVRAPEVDGSRVDGVRGLGHMRAAAFICNYAPHAAADGRSPSVVGALALRARHGLDVFVDRCTIAVVGGVRLHDVRRGHIEHMRAAALLTFAPHAAADGRSPSVVGAYAAADAAEPDQLGAPGPNRRQAR